MWANVAVQRDEGEALLAARGVAIRGRLGMGTRQWKGEVVGGWRVGWLVCVEELRGSRGREAQCQGAQHRDASPSDCCRTRIRLFSSFKRLFPSSIPYLRVTTRSSPFFFYFSLSSFRFSPRSPLVRVFLLPPITYVSPGNFIQYRVN